MTKFLSGNAAVAARTGRPDDDDRDLGVLFYETAQCFFLDLQDDAIRSATVGISNAAFAVELALKSYLLHAGFTDDWSDRHIGLDLTKALAHATNAGLDHAPDDLQRFLEFLTPCYAGGRTPSLARAVELGFPLSEITRIVENLIDRVGQAMGHKQSAGGEANDAA